MAAHVDDALMGGMRTDLSFTLFVEEPDTYDGGELVIETSAGESAIKGAGGCCICLSVDDFAPCCKLNSGARRVCVGWVQTHVRTPNKREILFDLDTARRALFQNVWQNGGV